MKKLVTKFMYIEWYYQLFIALIGFVLLALLIKFLIWIVPTLFVILLLLGVATQGEIFSIPFQLYKQENQTVHDSLFDRFYHWLTEEGVTELPISTLNFTQGVEIAGEGFYYVHINREISDELLEIFETKVRQFVKTMSNGSTDSVVRRAKREPFLAIKVRLVSADMMLMQKNQREEDF
jgi:hypothetical protein